MERELFDLKIKPAPRFLKNQMMEGKDKYEPQWQFASTETVPTLANMPPPVALTKLKRFVTHKT